MSLIAPLAIFDFPFHFILEVFVPFCNSSWPLLYFSCVVKCKPDLVFTDFDHLVVTVICQDVGYFYNIEEIRQELSELQNQNE